MYVCSPIHVSAYYYIYDQEIESHLLSCGSRANASSKRTVAGGAAGVSARSVDAVRSLLESLRKDLGESRCTQYYTSLRQRGIETHADLLALNWAQEARSGGALHSLLGSFAMDSLPPLVSVPQRAQEFKEVQKYFWEWSCNSGDPRDAEQGDCLVKIDAVDRKLSELRLPL